MNSLATAVAKPNTSSSRLNSPKANPISRARELSLKPATLEAQSLKNLLNKNNERKT